MSDIDTVQFSILTVITRNIFILNSSKLPASTGRFVVITLKFGQKYVDVSLRRFQRYSEVLLQMLSQHKPTDVYTTSIHD